MSLGKKQRPLVWVASSAATMRVSLFVLVSLLARLLDPADYAVVGIALVLVTGLNLLRESVVPQTTIFLSGDENGPWHALVMSLFASILIAAGFVMGGATLFARLFSVSEAAPLLLVLACLFVPHTLGTVSVARLEAGLRFDVRARIELGGAILGLAISVLIAIAYKTPWAFVAYIVTQALVLGLVGPFVARIRRVPLQKRLFVSGARYMLVLSGNASVGYLATTLDTVAVAQLLSQTDLGYYTLAFTVANIPATFFASVLGRFAFPFFVDGSPGNVETNRALLGSVVSLLSFIGWFSLASVIVAGELLISVAFGPSWEPMQVPLMMLVAYGAVRAVGGSIGTYLAARGLPHLNLRAALVNLGLVTLLVVPLPLRFGTGGAGLALLIAMCFSTAWLIVLLGQANVDGREVVGAGLSQGFFFIVLTLVASRLPETYGLLVVGVGAGAYFLLAVRKHLTSISRVGR